ncbi:MAG: class I SAM-dependent methyltransferase [Thermoflexales bacterium]
MHPLKKLRSVACAEVQLLSPTFQNWTRRLRQEENRLHRKIWEYCYIGQALEERGMLRAGKKGLGFAVGQEPLPAWFASRGCVITATDLAIQDARKDGWVESNQHAAGLEALNSSGISPEEAFRQRVSFRTADMRDIPPDLTRFDFLWSSCSLEHLGSMELGRKFIFDSLNCLNPGGIAVHTTEYNVSSNEDTLMDGLTVLYRRQDIERIGRELTEAGHYIDLDFGLGAGPADLFVDKPPYLQQVHLRLDISGFTVTSYGLIIRKAGRPGLFSGRQSV